MNSQDKTRSLGKRLLAGVALSALPLWTFVAMGTTGNFSSALDGHYNSSGQVLMSDGRVVQISQSLVFNKGRFYSMTRHAPAIAEASGRLETDLLGRVTLIVEEGQVSGLSPEDEMDDELMFNLLYGRHRGARITLEHIGACLYGVETRQVYCADDHPHRG